MLSGWAIDLGTTNTAIAHWDGAAGVARLLGAAAFAAGKFDSSDFIVHDYAIVTHDAQTHEPTTPRS